MAKLISILAASVGGGLVLGASIRLGEAIGSSAARTLEAERADDSQPDRTGTEQTSANTRVAVRLNRLEEMLARISSSQVQTAAQPTQEWQAALSGVLERIDSQQADVEAIRRQISDTTHAMDSVNGVAGDLRNELHWRLNEDLDQRLAAIEESFHVSLEAANRKTVDAMVASIETRLAPRILRLETDIAGQSAAVSELRECALQSERSIQRLLSVLEKLMDPQPRPAAPREPFAPAEARLAAVGGNGQEDLTDGSGDARRAPSLFVR